MDCGRREKVSSAVRVEKVWGTHLASLLQLLTFLLELCSLSLEFSLPFHLPSERRSDK